MIVGGIWLIYKEKSTSIANRSNRWSVDAPRRLSRATTRRSRCSCWGSFRSSIQSTHSAISRLREGRHRPHQRTGRSDRVPVLVYGHARRIHSSKSGEFRVPVPFIGEDDYRILLVVDGHVFDEARVERGKPGEDIRLESARSLSNPVRSSRRSSRLRDLSVGADHAWHRCSCVAVLVLLLALPAAASRRPTFPAASSTPITTRHRESRGETTPPRGVGCRFAWRPPRRTAGSVVLQAAAGEMHGGGVRGRQPPLSLRSRHDEDQSPRGAAPSAGSERRAPGFDPYEDGSRSSARSAHRTTPACIVFVARVAT